MKTIYRILASFFIIMTCWACQNEEEIDNVGYLSFNIDTYVSVQPGSKAIVDGYQPKRLTVQVVNAEKKVVYHTDDYDNWNLKGEKLPLVAGDYTVLAHSYGFDGKQSGFDIPYYAGSKSVSIKAGQMNIVEFTCTQQNVKVTVNFDPSFVKAFKKANAKITSALDGIQPVVFEMGTTSASAYFPAGKLSSTISVINKNDKQFSQTNVFAEDAKPRSHYILNYKVAESGSGNIKVETDDLQRTYTFTFKVSTKSATQLSMNRPSAWANFAMFTGSVLTQKAGEELNPQLMKFEYKKREADMWTELPAVLTGETYEAKATNLTPGTNYVGRMIYKGTQEYTSSPFEFSTETAAGLPNGNLDSWYKSGKTWYAASEFDFNAGKGFWDTSNIGTNKANKNNTEPESNILHTTSGKAAKIRSLSVVGVFAAGSLYSGEFGGLVNLKGAKLNLGRPFSSRPTQLSGWYQYSTGAVDKVGANQPEGTLKEGDQDLFTAYIALTTGSYVLNNTELDKTAKDYNKLLQDPKDNFVVAYGELSKSECVPSPSWKKFTIDLTYRNLVMKPTHVIIVFSSSKYGDYFTGSTKSVLYLDDLELVYGDNPRVVGK